MSKKSPEDLDKLFQQEPEQYPYAYNETSWDEMEKLLDVDDRRRFLWWWFIGIGALILIGSILFFEKNEEEIGDANLDFDKKENIKESKKEKPITLPLIQLQKEEIGKEGVVKPKIISKDIDENNINNSGRPFLEKKIETNKPIADVSVFEKNKKVIIDSVLQNNLFVEQINNEDLEERYPVSVLLTIDEVMPIGSLKYFLSTKNDFKILNINSRDTQLTSAPMEVVNRKTLMFGLAFGGESSKVKQSDFSKPNWKVGGLLEYRFRNHWSTSIGANFVKKKYKTFGSEYQPPTGFWVDAVAPQTIEADCNILEIPLKLGFSPNGYTRNGFYTNLGITSFFMLNERYDYIYEQEVPDQKLNWNGKNKNKHWFGIGEFSIGYQHFLNHKTILNIEPYMQIPLTGIGHGKVKLWTIGVSAKINFLVTYTN